MGEERGYSASSVILAFLIGGAVGIGLALALAPRAGRETRERLREVTEEATGRLKKVIEEGKDILEEGRKIITAVFEAGREAMKKEVERLKEEAGKEAAS